MFHVVGGHLEIGGDFLRLLRDFQLPRRGGETDLYGVWVPGKDLGPLAPSRAVAFVNDDVAEVVGGIERCEEVGRAVLGINVGSLVGGHVGARVPGIVAAVCSAVHLGGVGAENVLECAEPLRS
jgi:hypothetical protein